jgi:hypothetical protein
MQLLGKCDEVPKLAQFNPHDRHSLSLAQEKVLDPPDTTI